MHRCAAARIQVTKSSRLDLREHDAREIACTAPEKIGIAWSSANFRTVGPIAGARAAGSPTGTSARWPNGLLLKDVEPRAFLIFFSAFLVDHRPAANCLLRPHFLRECCIADPRAAFGCQARRHHHIIAIMSIAFSSPAPETRISGSARPARAALATTRTPIA